MRPAIPIALLLFVSLARAEDIRFPVGAKAVNVMMAPYNAMGDGAADDSAALQKAIDENKRQFRVLYFPNGTYKVSKALTFGSDREQAKHLVFQGQSQARTIIRLADSAPGFGDAKNPVPVLSSFSGANTGMAFTNSFYNLTIEVGAGNPGATALQYIGNNQSIVEDVTLRSMDKEHGGRAGLDLRGQWPGPCLVKNLTIDGFDTGVWSPFHWDYCVFFENLSLKNQRSLGIDVSHMTLCFRRLTSINSVPVLRITEDAYVTIIDGELSSPEGPTAAKPTTPGKEAAAAGKATALIGNPPALMRNVSAKGYAALSDRPGISGLTVKEWSSQPVISLFPSARTTFGMKVEETPETPWPDPNDWVLAEPGGSDQVQAAIDRAVNEKKTVVCLPRADWTFTKTIRVYGGVRRITGMFNAVRIGNPLLGSSDPLFRIEIPDAATLQIDRIGWCEGGGQAAPWFVAEHASNGTLVLKDLALAGQAYRSVAGKHGKVFIEDMVGEGFNFSGGQKVFCHYINPEGNAPVRMIDNNGAELWIFGIKHEVVNTVITTRNGGRTEMLAGLIYPSQGDHTAIPAFVVDDASFVGTWFEGVGDRYDTFVTVTRKGDSKTLGRQNTPDSRRVPLFIEGH